MELDKSLLELPFDQYQRYRLASDIVNFLRLSLKDKLKLLDVGGYPGLILRFLPEDNITIIDREEWDSPNYLKADALDMPFDDNAFDIVLTLDVIEHIPDDRRAKFIKEICRVAREFIILGAPFETEDVSLYETLTNSIYKINFGKDHQWLREHLRNGLPDLEETAGRIKEIFPHLCTIPNGYLPRWMKMISTNLIFQDYSPYIEQLNRFYNEKFYPYDNKMLSYRQIIVGGKKEFSLSVPVHAEDEQSFRNERVLDDMIENLHRIRLSKNLSKIGNDMKDAELVEAHSRPKDERARSQQQLERFHTDILEKERQLTEVKLKLEYEMACKQRELEHLQTSIQKLQTELHEKEQVIVRKSAHVTHLENVISEKDAQIMGLYGSYSWRITAPLRIAYDTAKVPFLFFKRRKMKKQRRERLSVSQFLKNIFHIATTYDLKQVIPNIRMYGFNTFLENAKKDLLGKEDATAKIATNVKSSTSTKTASVQRITEYWHSEYNEHKTLQDYNNLKDSIRNYHNERIRNLPMMKPDVITLPNNTHGLLRYGSKLKFKNNRNPLVSIIIPVYNNVKFTLECLFSIRKYTDHREIPFEIVVVDDGSKDMTEKILSSVGNLRYVRNTENMGFVRSCNKGASMARGEYIVILNNDVQVTKGWLRELLATFRDIPDAGIVGPKVIYPFKRLQEAGARVNPDCSTQMIGLNDDWNLARYNYIREVEYCSGVCLLMRRDIFQKVGGFDEIYAPAYFEDVDLCFKVRQLGLKVIYNPKSVIVHHLSVTSKTVGDDFKMYQVTRNQQKFSEQWQREVDRLNRVRLIAFYLPQFHPIPENDLWWGKGFTEWRNITKALPNFIGHYQPRIPADLGYYDLRIPDVMDQQAELAKRYGLFGFCYYYYWFGGKRLLGMPIEQMLKSGRPDIPFCLCWANENWTRKWDGKEDDILIAQNHSDDDDRAVILDIIRYMRDPRYIRINGKPLLLIYRISQFPDVKRTVKIWRETCMDEGIGEIYLAMVESFELAVSYAKEPPSKYGFDASVEFPPHQTDAPTEPPGEILNPEFKGSINDYRKLVMRYIKRDIPPFVRFRTVLAGWDNTPRRQNDPYTFVHDTPGAYQAWLETIIEQTLEQNFGDERIVFINAWNEWAEGAYLEPDIRNGHAYLEATCNALEKNYLCNEKK